jgi:diguanylate cyclase (GGDEF)-like protein
MRNLVKRLGLLPATLLFTALAVAASLTIYAAIQWASGASIAGSGLWISIFIPAVIAPLFSYFQLKLYFELDRTRQALQTQAATDELTGAANRRRFLEEAEREFSRAVRYGGAFAILLLDLDDFKEINDRFGHPVGDDLLKQFSQLCQQNIRQDDLFARFGGDEFILLLPEADAASAAEFAERLRHMLETTPLTGIPGQPVITASMGVVPYHPRFTDIRDLLAAADQALYQAKAGGKNRIVVQDPGAAGSSSPPSRD